MKLKITILAMLFAISVSAQVNEVPTPRYGHSVCEIDDNYYIFGGYIDIHKTNNKNLVLDFPPMLVSYSRTNKTFTDLSSSSTDISGMAKHTAINHNAKMYVFGGVRSNLSDNAVYSFTPSSNIWQQGIIQPFFPCILMSGYTIGDKIYICGGKNSDNTTSTDVYEYDPDVSNFVKKADMPQGGRYGHTAINNNGNLLIYGGRNDSGEQGQMLQYNVNGNYWNFFDPVGMPPMARANNLSGVLPDEMWIAGGETWSTKKSTQSTNFYTDIWKLDLSQTPAKWIKKSENFIPVTNGVGWLSVEDNDTLFYSFGGISEITSTGDTTVTNNFYRYNITESIVEQYHEDTQNWGGIITSINENDFSQNINLQIYPNPATSEINLKIPNNESIVSIKIYNQNGQLVKQINNPNDEKINVLDLKSGLYFIRTDTETNRYLSKMIKE